MLQQEDLCWSFDTLLHVLSVDPHHARYLNRVAPRPETAKFLLNYGERGGQPSSPAVRFLNGYRVPVDTLPRFSQVVHHQREGT